MLKKILIVEDDRFLRELISQKLTKEGYETLEAIDGEDGLKKIKNDQPDPLTQIIILSGFIWVG